MMTPLLRLPVRAMLAGLCLLAAACKHRAKPDEVLPQAHPPSPPPLPVEIVVGHVSLVANDNAFLVFQLDAGCSAGVGEEFEIRYAGTKVGRAKVTPPIEKRFVTADIIEGSAEKGQEIVRMGKTP